MNILVIGASGFLGQHVVSCFQLHGHRVWGTTFRSGGDGLITFDLGNDNILQCVPKAFLNSADPKCAIFCAGVTPMDRCVTDFAYAHDLMVTKTLRTIRDLRTADCRCVFISTSHVFDDSTPIRTEESTPAPIGTYAELKLEAENAIIGDVPDTLIYRLDKLIGNDPTTTHLLTEWYGKMGKGVPIVTIADQVFSPTLVNDIADAIVIGCRLQLYGIYHVASPIRIARSQLARDFVAMFDTNSVVVERSASEIGLLDRRCMNSWLDSNTFTSRTGFSFTKVGTILDSFARNVGRSARKTSSKTQPSFPSTTPQPERQTYESTCHAQKNL